MSTSSATSSPRFPNPLQLFAAAAAQFPQGHPVSPSQMLPMTSASGFNPNSSNHHGLQLSPNSIVLQKKQSRPTFTGHQVSNFSAYKLERILLDFHVGKEV